MDCVNPSELIAEVLRAARPKAGLRVGDMRIGKILSGALLTGLTPYSTFRPGPAVASHELPLHAIVGERVEA